MNIGQILRQSALRAPTRPAVVDLAEGRQVLDAAHLEGGARRVAGWLRARGVGPGDAVGLAAQNGAGFVMAWFGVVYTGAAVVPIPILSAAPEVTWRLSRTRARFLLADRPRLPLADRCEATAVPLEEALAHPRPLDRPVDTPPGGTAMVLFTSGTTGSPQGAAISHAALMLHTATLVRDTLGLDADDRILGVLPLTHSFGCRMVMLAGLYAGARLVLVPRFDRRDSLRILDAEGITWLPAVPTMYAAWAQAAPAPHPGLRWCLSAGAPLAPEVGRAAEAVLGAEVREGYGMTEATFSTVNAPPDPRVRGSVGRPVWGVEVQVVDPAGQPLPPGEAGEVRVRGHHLMSGYLDDPAATEEVLRDGWMRSGDLGRLDPEGRLTIVDRLKDLILSGGNNVYPSEVEAALVAHPGIAQAVVVGRPDPYYGEAVVAVVVPAPGAHLTPEAVAAWAREQVARPKVPRAVAVVDALPQGASGKVVRREVRRRILDRELVPHPTDGRG